MLFSHLKHKFTSWYCADYCSQYAWKVVKLNICMSQGSAATELRRGGRFKSDFVRHFFLDATLKEFLKLVYICQSYHKNKSDTFFYGSQCVYIYASLFIIIWYKTNIHHGSKCLWNAGGTPLAAASSCVTDCFVFSRLFCPTENACGALRYAMTEITR